MHVLRRAALRSALSPLPLISKPRSLKIVAVFSAPRIQEQRNASLFQRRFASASTSDAPVVPEDHVFPPKDDEVVTPQHTATEAAVDSPAEISDPDASSSITASELNTVAAAAEGQRTRDQSRENANPGSNLYVGNLYFEVREPALRSVFEPFGNIESVKVIMDQRGLSKGFGYVEFSTVESATRAKESLSQQVFEGRRMMVQYAEKRAPRTGFKEWKPSSPSKTLFVGNMSYEMSDKDLNELFREVKNVVDVRVAIDRRTGQPRGFAHADFIDVDSATKAKEMLSDRVYYGRKLRIDYGKSSAER